MASLKDLRRSIETTKSTRRITSAMKMMSAAKLRRAQTRAEEAKPYAERSIALAQSLKGRLLSPAPPLFIGREKEKGETKTLYLAIASARGLCGGYNANVAKRVLALANEETEKNISAILVGRKARPALHRALGERLLSTHEDVNRPVPHEAFAQAIATELISMFEQERFDRCLLVYNHFRSALVQEVVVRTVVPIGADETQATATSQQHGAGGEGIVQEQEVAFEPERDLLLQKMAPQIVAAQIFEAMLDAFAAEQASRMTAMDNATRNAGELIDELSLRYNRLRQATITTELIEIISGSAALRACRQLESGGYEAPFCHQKARINLRLHQLNSIFLSLPSP